MNNNNLGGSSGGGGTEDNNTAGEPTDTTEEVYTAGGANDNGEDQGDPNSNEDNIIEEEPTIKYSNINFNLKRQPNVAQVLKGFVQEAIRTTKQEKIKFIASNRTTTPPPAPITRMSQYPETELKHKQFFQHHLNNRRTHITVWYSLITTLDIHKLKNRMMPYIYICQR